MVKISVIIPVYNVEKYLKKCLDSVLNQTLKDIEVICIDDGSTDSSLDILNSYDDERLNILSQNNEGAAVSRNKGIDIAKGEYISFVDSDDWLELDAFEKLYGNAKSNDSDMVLFNAIEIKPNNKIQKRVYWPINENIDYDNFVFDYNYAKKLVLNGFFVPWSKLYKTSFIKKNNLKFYNHKIFNDVQFHIESMLLAKRLSYRPEFYYNYNKLNVSSLQSNKSSVNNRLIIFDIFNEVENFLLENNFFHDFKANFFEFKIVESEVNLNKSFVEFKAEFYNHVRNEFVKMDINIDILKQIPLEFYRFYSWVLINETYDKFNEYKTMIKTRRLRGIYKPNFDEEIRNFNDCGINKEMRKESIIVSLTSFPERMYDIHYCLYSLLNQEFKPDKVILWLAESQFPNKEDDIPSEVLQLKNNGLSIEWCDDLKSYKKIIPALKQYPDSFIVTADDDIFYPYDWLKTIWNEYKNNPYTIISSRTRRITFSQNNSILKYSDWSFPVDKLTSYINFPTNGAGSLFFPNALSKMVLNEELFLKLCPSGDDIWIWAMAVLNNTKITSIGNPMADLNYVNVAREVGVLDDFTLWQINKVGENDIQLKKVLNEFPEIINKITNE